MERWTGTIWLVTIAWTLSACSGGSEDKSQSPSEEEKAIQSDSLLKKSPGKESELVRYPDGSKKLTGHLENGKRHGVWSSWYKDGSLKSELRYRHGKRHGFYKTWYKNGQLRYKGQYHHGERTGTWKFYGKSGALINKKNFGKAEGGKKDQ